MTGFAAPGSDPYVHPHGGMLGRAVGALANSQRIAAVRRALMSHLPFPVLESDVRDVVYITWMVDAARAHALTPPGVPLWAANGLTPFTILTYRHGHFGPSLLGPLRRFCPSPLQSNWRLYLRGAAPGAPGAPDVRTVLFVRNVMDSLVHALGTRLLSDALPTHLPATFEFDGAPDRARVHMRAGTGSAPTFEADFAQAPERTLPPAFSAAFADWMAAVAYLTLQDAAIAPVPHIRKLAFAEISLPADVGTITPLQVNAASLSCPFVESLAPSGPPLCFHLPRVRFRALSERLLPE